MKRSATLILGLCAAAAALAVAAGLATLASAGCDAGECPGLAGTWQTTAHCEGAAVGASHTLTQEGCDFTLEGYDVDLDGHLWHEGSVSIHGELGGSTRTCSGTVGGGVMDLSCDVGSQPCQVQLVLASLPARGGGTGAPVGSGGARGSEPEPAAPDCPSVGRTYTMTAYCDDPDAAPVGESISVGQEGCELFFSDSLFFWSGTIDAGGDITITTDFLGNALTCQGGLKAAKQRTGGGGSYNPPGLELTCDPDLCGGPGGMTMW